MNFPEQVVPAVRQPTPAVPSAQQDNPSSLAPPVAAQREASTWQTSSQTPQPLDTSQSLDIPLGDAANSVSRSPAPPPAVVTSVPASTAAPPSAQVSLPQVANSTPHILAPQSQYLPTSTFDANHSEANTQRKRGRPRKYFDEESKRAAEQERRRKKRKSDADGDYTSDDGDSEGNANGTSGTGKKDERRPYLHYQMDFGKYDNTKPGALTARDIVVNWLADGTNFKDWLSWSMDKKNEIAQMLRKELRDHGMLDRDTISVKQQVSCGRSR